MCSELLRIGPLASMLKRIQISIRKQFPEFISIIHFQNPFPTSYPKTLEAAGGHWKPVEATKQLELISHWRPLEVGCHLLGFGCHLLAIWKLAPCSALLLHPSPAGPCLWQCRCHASARPSFDSQKKECDTTKCISDASDWQSWHRFFRSAWVWSTGNDSEDSREALHSRLPHLLEGWDQRTQRCRSHHRSAKCPWLTRHSAMAREWEHRSQ